MQEVARRANSYNTTKQAIQLLQFAKGDCGPDDFAWLTESGPRTVGSRSLVSLMLIPVFGNSCWNYWIISYKPY